MKYILISIFAVSLYGCFGKTPEKTALKGKPIPSFKLLLPDSTTWYDTKDIPSGKPVVLLYFGPHCPYSRAQMEEIIKDMDILKDIRFYVFTPYPFREMKDFYNHYQLNKYPNIVTGMDTKNFFGDYFEARGVPYTAIYGKDRRLNESFIGKIYGSQIKEVADN